MLQRIDFSLHASMYMFFSPSAVPLFLMCRFARCFVREPQWFLSQLVSVSMSFRRCLFPCCFFQFLFYWRCTWCQVCQPEYGWSSRCDSPSVGSLSRIPPLSGSRLHSFSCMVAVCGSSFCVILCSDSSSSTPCFSLIKQVREFRVNLIQNVKKQQCCAE